MNKKHIRRGDIYYANLDPVIGSEQGDNRPVVVVQNEAGNKHSPTVVIVPLTRNLDKKPLPTHVLIPQSDGLNYDSLALTEQIRTIDRTRIGGYIGCVGDSIQTEIDVALAVCMGIDMYQSASGSILTLCLCYRCEHDFKESGHLLVKKGWQASKEYCDFCGARRGFVFGIFRPA